MNNGIEHTEELEPVLKKMKNDWNERVLEDAEKFIYGRGTIFSFQQYDEHARLEPPRMADLLKTTFPNVSTSNMKILEIGCGVGRLTKGLLSFFGHYIGIDVSEEMINLAKNRLGDLSNVEFYVNNGFDLNMIDDSTIDLVLEAYVFQHVPQKNIVNNYCKEAFRVLKNGGFFMALFWKNKLDKEYDGVDSGQYRGNNVTNTNDTIIGVQFNENEIKEMLTKLGFIDVRFINNHKIGRRHFLHHLVIART